MSTAIIELWVRFRRQTLAARLFLPWAWPAEVWIPKSLHAYERNPGGSPDGTYEDRAIVRRWWAEQNLPELVAKLDAGPVQRAPGPRYRLEGVTGRNASSLRITDSTQPAARDLDSMEDFRAERKAARLSLTETATLLGLTVLQVSALDDAYLRFASPEDLRRAVSTMQAEQQRRAPRGRTGETMTTEDRCPGAGKCHGCLRWCDKCGDVSKVCDAPKCDTHPSPGEQARARAERVRYIGERLAVTFDGEDPAEVADALGDVLARPKWAELGKAIRAKLEPQPALPPGLAACYPQLDGRAVADELRQIQATVWKCAAGHRADAIRSTVADVARRLGLRLELPEPCAGTGKLGVDKLTRLPVGARMIRDCPACSASFEPAALLDGKIPPHVPGFVPVTYHDRPDLEVLDEIRAAGAAMPMRATAGKCARSMVEGSAPSPERSALPAVKCPRCDALNVLVGHNSAEPVHSRLCYLCGCTWKFGGPLACMRCSECEGLHHWGNVETLDPAERLVDQFVGAVEDAISTEVPREFVEGVFKRDQHPAAKAGLEAWRVCKHCPAWREDVDADDDEANPLVLFGPVSVHVDEPTEEDRASRTLRVRMTVPTARLASMIPPTPELLDMDPPAKAPPNPRAAAPIIYEQDFPPESDMVDDGIGEEGDDDEEGADDDQH